jgi:hypothetical protein
MSESPEIPEIPEIPVSQESIPTGINYQIISELNNRGENRIKDFKNIVRILGNSILRNQKPADNTELLSQLQYIDYIYKHINDPKPTQEQFYMFFLEELLYYYEKKIGIYTDVHDRLQNVTEIATSLIANISMYNLNNAINKYIYNEAAILSLLQSISFIDEGINKYTRDINDYDVTKKASEAEEELLRKQMLQASGSKEEKIEQIKKYYDFALKVEQDSISNNDVNADIIRFLESVKLFFLRQLSDLTTADIQSILRLKISTPYNAEPQQDIITLLTYYWASKETLKTGVQTEETILEQKEIEMRIKKNIELLCEVLLKDDKINPESLSQQMGNQAETPILDEGIELRDLSKKPDTIPNTLDSLPEQIKAEIKKEYEFLFKIRETENKKQEKIINELLSLQRAKKELDKPIDELSESVATEIISQNWNSLDIFYINQLINGYVLSSLSKLSYDIVKVVKIKVVELLRTKISEKIKLSINDELTEATNKSDKAYKSWDDASKKNKPLSEAEQLDFERLKTEFDVAYKIMIHLQREKTRIMATIDEYIDNWFKRQIDEIKSVGFSASLVKKPEEIQSDNPDICAIIDTTREKVRTANYFPLQFPTLV